MAAWAISPEPITSAGEELGSARNTGFLWVPFCGHHEGVASQTGQQVLRTSGCLSFFSASPSQLRNVLELIEFFEGEDRFYLVFEKMRGGGY